MTQNEITVEQATQNHSEFLFLSKHHEELGKHYLRQAIFTEQAILQAREVAEKQSAAEAEEAVVIES